MVNFDKDLDSVLTVLQGARDLVGRGWTQYALARDSVGAAVEYWDESVCSLCALGAIYTAARGHLGEDHCYPVHRDLSAKAIQAVEAGLGNDTISDFNDSESASQDAVVEAFGEAIERVSANV